MIYLHEIQTDYRRSSEYTKIDEKQMNIQLLASI
jgi:hypothetical protein